MSATSRFPRAGYPTVRVKRLLRSSMEPSLLAEGRLLRGTIDLCRPSIGHDGPWARLHMQPAVEQGHPEQVVISPGTPARPTKAGSSLQGKLAVYIKRPNADETTRVRLRGRPAPYPHAYARCTQYGYSPYASGSLGDAFAVCSTPPHSVRQPSVGGIRQPLPGSNVIRASVRVASASPILVGLGGRHDVRVAV